MARATHDILVRSELPIGQFADEVAKALGVEFKTLRGELWAVADDYGVGVRAATYTGYEQYGFAVELAADDEEEKHARAAFEALKSIGTPMLLCAHDLQVELDRFDPPAS